MSPAIGTTITVAGRGGVSLVLDDYRASADAVPVVLMHGGAQTRQSWGRVPLVLAGAGFRPVCVDLRGHGDSQWAPDADYSPDALVEDALRISGYLDRRAIMVGASLGGLVSMMFASRHPTATEGLVLVDVVPRNNAQGVNRIRQFMAANPDGFADFEEAVNAVSAYQSHRPRPSKPVGLWKNLRRNNAGRLVWHWDPQFLLREGRAWSEGREELFVEEAGRLTVPTALLIGGDSDVVDAAARDDFLRTVPHATVATVERATHMIAGDRNDAFGAELLRICATMRSQAHGGCHSANASH